MSDELSAAIDEIAAESRFSGVVRVDVDGAVALERAYGLADRSHRIAMSVETHRSGIGDYLDEEAGWNAGPRHRRRRRVLDRRRRPPFLGRCSTDVWCRSAGFRR